MNENKWYQNDNVKARELFLDNLQQYTNFKPGDLIRKWSGNVNEPIKPETYSEIVNAIVDALTQEGQIAWNGDGTSIVAGYVIVQMMRAEKAEAELGRYKRKET